MLEALVIAVIIASLTITTCMGVITGDDYVKIVLALFGYVFGRMFNHVQGKES